MIRLEHLTKQYPSGKGIRDINLQIPYGGAFGFLGPNGAGKTTTIRVLMGLLQPDNGGARIKDLDCWQNRTEVKHVVGYLPGELHFPDYFLGSEFLELMRRMHGGKFEIQNNCKQLAEHLDLDTKQSIRKMSKGMKQKLGIISALMLDFEVLIMDEPTSGLDPLMQQVFIDLILEEKKKGKTIFMSSHQFQEIERTCEQVGIIREGQLLTVQDINRIKQMECHTFEVEVENEEYAEYLHQCGLEVYRDKGLSFIIKITGNFDSLWQVLSGIKVKKFRQRFLELEEAFIQYYR
ncbi:MAG: ABC transporter ATP-binding protein [Gracilibacter sp. BRH_c7a]|nr:MAG: ABC transporter ATP-binding protein [Gracilibacter sp. BRH_c7a]